MRNVLSDDFDAKMFTYRWRQIMCFNFLWIYKLGSFRIVIVIACDQL